MRGMIATLPADLQLLALGTQMHLSLLLGGMEMSEKVGEKKTEVVPRLVMVQVMESIVSLRPHPLLWQNRSWWTAAWDMGTGRDIRI